MTAAADTVDDSMKASLRMKVRASSKATSVAVEYFLYTVVIIEAAIAAFAYKTVAQAVQLWPGATAYLAVLYLGVLGWVFYQLNRLHRQRKAVAKAAASADVTHDEPAGVAVAVQIENGAMEIGDEPAAVASPASARLLFGFTRTQLAIVLLVFVAAMKVFSWALSTLARP